MLWLWSGEPVEELSDDGVVLVDELLGVLAGSAGLLGIAWLGSVAGPVCVVVVELVVEVVVVGVDAFVVCVAAFVVGVAGWLAFAAAG